MLSFCILYFAFFSFQTGNAHRIQFRKLKIEALVSIDCKYSIGSSMKRTRTCTNNALSWSYFKLGNCRYFPRNLRINFQLLNIRNIYWSSNFSIVRNFELSLSVNSFLSLLWTAAFHPLKTPYKNDRETVRRNSHKHT